MLLSAIHKLYLVFVSELLVQMRAHDLVPSHRGGGEVVLHEQSSTVNAYALIQPGAQQKACS